jgi:hypothetical protein
LVLHIYIPNNYFKLTLEETYMNIKNKYCLLSELNQDQIDKLVGLVPCADYFDFNKREALIGFSPNGNAGTWRRGLTDEIITYKEMLSLLGAEEEEQLVPHVHQKEIIAWANGEEIEFQSWIDLKWKDKDFDSWDEDNKFRVKPKLTPTQLRIKEINNELHELHKQDAVERGIDKVMGN